MGSSFLPSEITAAFLWAQLENLDKVQTKRLQLWERYYERLNSPLLQKIIKLPAFPGYATNNDHIFYVICSDIECRDELIQRLKLKGILAVFHYISLHDSPFYRLKYKDKDQDFSSSKKYTDCLLRLPLFYELDFKVIDQIRETIDETAKIL